MNESTYNAIIRNGKIYGGGSGSSGGIGIKSISWTGTGTTSHDITFPEKPTLLLALQGSSGGGYLQFAPVEYGGTQWNYIWSNSYINGSIGNVGLTYSADDLTMTMTHSNADGAAACNLSGVTYTLYYI